MGQKNLTAPIREDQGVIGDFLRYQAICCSENNLLFILSLPSHYFHPVTSTAVVLSQKPCAGRLVKNDQIAANRSEKMPLRQGQ
jgi:hypothetical protein